VVAAEAAYFHLQTAFVNDSGFSSATTLRVNRASQWILLSRSRNVLSLPAIAQASSPLHPKHGLHLWTDEESNLLQILR